MDAVFGDVCKLSLWAALLTKRQHAAAVRLEPEGREAKVRKSQTCILGIPQICLHASRSAMKTDNFLCSIINNLITCMFDT